MVQSTCPRVVSACVWLMALCVVVGCQRVEDDRIELTTNQKQQLQSHLIDQAPEPDHEIGAQFNDNIELLGVDIDGRFEPGEPIELTWYWRADADVSTDWQIFVHFDTTADGGLRQNLDHYPLGDQFDNSYRTYHWEEGDLIADTQQFILEEGYPAGEATFYVGLFLGDRRAEITNDVDSENRRVIGPTVEVQAAR